MLVRFCPCPTRPEQSLHPTCKQKDRDNLGSLGQAIHVPLSLWRAFTHSCWFPLLAMCSPLSSPGSFWCSRSGFGWYLWEAFAKPSNWMDVSASPSQRHPYPGDSLASLTSFFTGLEASGGHALSSFLDLARVNSKHMRNKWNTSLEDLLCPRHWTRPVKNGKKLFACASYSQIELLIK